MAFSLAINGWLVAGLVVALGGLHAKVEYRAFSHTTAGRGDAGGGRSADWLWLVSGVSFVGFEVATAVAVVWSWETWTLGRLTAVIGGGLIYVLGVGVRCRAIEALSHGFAVPPFTDRELSLETGGIFAVVRHPSELGLALMSLGLVAIAADAQVLAVLLGWLAPLSAWRIVREELWLRETATAHHRRYCESTVLLVPRGDGWRALARIVVLAGHHQSPDTAG